MFFKHQAKLGTVQNKENKGREAVNVTHTNLLESRQSLRGPPIPIQLLLHFAVVIEQSRTTAAQPTNQPTDAPTQSVDLMETA